ncbi:Septum formation initiator [gut metagenome]|uniref:Septum formation initiator n=1 Tax=gut metagenome TaxID=749906 RepID=J9D188_9ZZZZ
MTVTRIFIVILAAGIVAVGMRLVGPDGVWYRTVELEKAIALQQAENAKQRFRNEELAAELYSLENRSGAIEEKARRELFMVKADEILFRMETAEEYSVRSRQTSDMPSYRSPKIRPGSRPTFDAKKADLYHAPKHLRAPPARGRR